MRDGRLGLAVFLRARRRAAGLTQRELAERAGLGVGTVRDLEQGRTRRPHPASLDRLGGALGLDPAQAAELDRALQSAEPVVGLMAGTGWQPATGVWLQVLGPLTAWRTGMRIGLGEPKQRAVLGLLAVNPNVAVTREALIDAVWGGAPPATAGQLVQAYVSRLRHLLDPGRSPRDPAGLLVSAAGSYRLQVTADQLDLLAFRQFTVRAGSACGAGDGIGACENYERALGLWQGEPLADVPALCRHPAVIAVARDRVAAVGEYARTAFGSGSPDRALPHLQELAAREPFNEYAHAQLMIALASVGQQAAALQVFHDIRARLDQQLGVEPCPELAEAHVRVLRQQMPPTAPAAATTGSLGAPGSRPPAPRQLPGAVSHFTGRAAELADLDRLLTVSDRDSAGGDGGASTVVVISAVSGTAGVGKTALALNWAHRVRGHFPDGQLYVNLRGYHPERPLSATDALSAFLRALGMPGKDIPPATEERAAAYRSLLDGRRMLIVLDNAGTVEQVRPLLPGSPSCRVLVTSRDRLPALVAVHGAHRLDLDVLPPADAVALLRALIGRRVETEPDAAGVLAAQCARLPLALRLAAELAAAHPRTSLTDLAAELADQQRRLDLLDRGGDPHGAVSSVFSWSYQHLPVEAARTFRLLGLHPGTDFDAYAAAALTGASLRDTDRLLDLLARVHLIHSTRPGRYGMHDLLRAYASGLAAETDAKADRRTALTGLLDYYLATAAAAMDTLHPAEQHRRPRVAPPATPTPATADSTAALAWLDTERASLTAVCCYATVHGWPGHATRLAATLFRYLDIGAHFGDATAIHTSALHAARHTGDWAAEATARISLGGVYWRQGHHRQATDHVQQALTVFRQIGDRDGEARALGNLGGIDWREGRYQQAVDHLRHALTLFRQIGDRDGEARALDSLGLVYGRQGRYQLATECHQEALALYRRTGDRDGEAHTLDNLGNVYRRQGHHQQASDHYEQALILYRRIGDRGGEAQALNGLGETREATAQPDEARIQHTAALALATETGNRYEQARAHHGLAQTHHTTGQDDQARHHWQHALALYTDLGVPDADDVRAHLAALG